MQQSVAQTIQHFLDYLKFQKRYSQHTIISYKNDLDAFFVYLQYQFGETPPADIKATFIRSWLAELKQQGIESKSINRKISTLKSFFKYQLRQQTIAVSPMTAIISPRVNKRLPRFVDDKDIATLFTDVEFPDTWDGKTQRRYSWWSQRFPSVRLNNKGWRIDYINVTEPLKKNLKDADIFPDVKHSDHCPVYLEIKN